MKSVVFEETNREIGTQQDEFNSVYAFANGMEVVTCWELTDEEIEQIVKTKKLFLNQLTYGKPMQAVFLTVYKEALLPKVPFTANGHIITTTLKNLIEYNDQKGK